MGRSPGFCLRSLPGAAAVSSLLPAQQPCTEGPRRDGPWRQVQGLVQVCQHGSQRPRYLPHSPRGCRFFAAGSIVGLTLNAEGQERPREARARSPDVGVVVGWCTW